MKTKTKPAGVTPAATNGSAKPIEEKVELKLLEDLLISERNTRQPKPSEPGIKELALSMSENGQTTPAIVRPHPKQKGKFEIGAGSRRRVAAELNKWSNLAVVVRNLDDTAFEELILVENLQREDPDPKAEVDLLDRLVKRGIHTAAQISAHLGKPEHWVARRLQLLKVIPELRTLWQKGGERSMEHFSTEMMSLVGTLPVDTQKMLLGRDAWQFRECESTGELRKYLDQTILCRLDQAPFDLKDPRFCVKGCGPGCANDSSMLSDLFETDKKGPPRCLNVACFKQRLALATAQRYKDVAGKEDLPVVGRGYNAPRAIQLGSREVRVHESYEYGHGGISEKETAGAKKVVVLGDNGSMKIGYIPKRAASSGGTKQPKAPGAALAERKRILQGKRLFLVHEQLVKALLETKHTEITEDLIDLVAVFGLPYEAHDWYGDQTWKQFDDRKKIGFPLQANSHGYVPEYERRTPKAKGVDKSREAALWHGLQNVLCSVITLPHRVGDVPKRENAMQRVAKLIKFPFAVKKKEADLKILPPRSWGKVDPHTLEPVKQSLKTASPTAKAISAKLVPAKKGLTGAMRRKLSEAMKKRWATKKTSAKKGGRK